MSYPTALNEEARLAALYELELLDTPDEPAFDRVTRLVTQLLNVPISTITLIAMPNVSGSNLVWAWIHARQAAMSHFALTPSWPLNR